MKKYIALLLAFVLLLSLAACGQSPEKTGKNDPGSDPSKDRPHPKRPTEGYQLMAAVYPQLTKLPNEEEYRSGTGQVDWTAYSEAYDQYTADRRALRTALGTYEEKLLPYLQKAIPGFLSENAGENPVCSPLNIYMALAMTAECTDGASRAQLLDLLGVKDLTELRTVAKALWENHYCDDGVLTSTLGSSLWMADKFEFNDETLALLAEHYYASSFAGELTDADFFESFKNWLNEQTGGLLKDQIGKLEPFTEDSLMTIATTIYFKGRWSADFDKSLTAPDTFHAPGGDLQTDFMHNVFTGSYYVCDGFTAVPLSMDGGARMWIFLPDEGHSAAELLAGGKAASWLMSETREQQSFFRSIHVSLPKFDVNASLNLNDSLQKLGVTEIFNPLTADFSPLTPTPNTYVSKVQHDARVKIDEEGCEAAAFTLVIMYNGTAMSPDEVEFIVDRPFVFAITMQDDLPLFVGQVNVPQ